MPPWLDRAGRFSPLKTAAFALVLAPGLWVALRWSLFGLGAKPVTAAIHQTGDWAIRFLLASLAVSPLRRIADWPKLILVRRMLGLAVLGYGVIHLLLYVVDQNFGLWRVASEIALRVYLTIGFAALLGLSVLGATSTDAAIRRMGARWHRLHRTVYVLAALGLVHFYLQSKINVTEPVLMTGLFFILMGYRLMHRFGLAGGPLSLIGLGLGSALLTALVEAGWYAGATGVPPWPVLEANLDFSYDIRPAWWVLATGLGLALLNGVRRFRKRPRTRQPPRGTPVASARA